jgi:hypothetical protein
VLSAAFAFAIQPAAQAPPPIPESSAAPCDAQLPHDAKSGPEQLAALSLSGRPLDAAGRRAFTAAGWAPGDMTGALARAILRVHATPAQRQAWSNCLETQTQGVRLYVVEDTPTGVQAEVSYHGAAGEAPRVRLDVEGGRIDNTYKTKFVRVKDGAGVMIAITRETPQSHVAIFANSDNGRWDEAISPAPGADLRTARRPAERFLGGGQKVTVSNGNASAKFATDGDTKTTWNSGGPAPQWIEIAFKPAKTITQIQLIVEQRPRGLTKHTVRGFRADGTEVPLAYFAFLTDAGSEMSARIAPGAGRGITRLRIDSDAGPSWVAFREVRIFGY